MSDFLKMLRQRFKRTNENQGDYVPWQLDDKYQAYKFVQEKGWITPRFVRCKNIEDALATGKSFGGRFLVKQPNRHSGKGIYLLEHIEGKRFFEFLTLREIIAENIKADGPLPDYWLAEECVHSTIAGKPIPFDYKIYCFSGVPTLILQIDRNISPPRFAVFDGAFIPLEHNRHYGFDQKRWLPSYHVIPLHAPKMLVMASDLSGKTNSRFVSIDCYDGKSGPVFGEFTFAPGGPDVGMIRFQSDILALLDKAARGEKIPSLAGIDISIVDLINSVKKNPILMKEEIFSVLSASAAAGDRRYGRVFPNALLSHSKITEHFRFIARMIGAYNGDCEQYFLIAQTIIRREGFLVGDSRRTEFEDLALEYHNKQAPDNPWHSTRIAQIKLAQGDKKAIDDLIKIAATGYKHAEIILRNQQFPFSLFNL